MYFFHKLRVVHFPVGPDLQYSRNVWSDGWVPEWTGKRVLLCATDENRPPHLPRWKKLVGLTSPTIPHLWELPWRHLCTWSHVSSCRSVRFRCKCKTASNGERSWLQKHTHTKRCVWWLGFICGGGGNWPLPPPPQASAHSLVCNIVWSAVFYRLFSAFSDWGLHMLQWIGSFCPILFNWNLSTPIFFRPRWQCLPFFTALNHSSTILSEWALWCSTHSDKLWMLSCVLFTFANFRCTLASFRAAILSNCGRPFKLLASVSERTLFACPSGLWNPLQIYLCSYRTGLLHQS